MDSPLLQHVARGLSFGAEISPIYAEASPSGFEAGFHLEMGDSSSQDDSHTFTNSRVRRQAGRHHNLQESLLFEEVDEVLEVEAERIRVVAHDEGEESNQRQVEQKQKEVEQKQKDAFSLMSTVTRLAAKGSATVRSTMMAILVGSMTNDNAREYLVQSGYSEARQEIVIKRKKETNEKNRKAKRTILLEETAELKFEAPLANHEAAKKAKINFNTLLQGKDISSGHRTTSVSQDMVDALVSCIVRNTQFRPGRTRNVVLRGVKLEDLPVHMRYGPIRELYNSYCSATKKELKVGEKTFREVMAALTLKGTYNQGLSYFYVDFVDMISLILKMIKRLGEMVKDPSLPKDGQEEVETWLERAKRQTEFSSEYLRHQFYGDIQKSSTNGYVCAQWALGHTCEHKHDFPEDHSLSLVLTNHCMIAFAIERVNDAVDLIHLSDGLNDDEYKALVDEIFPMMELTKLSHHEMLHYIKHLMRGWWQDTAIK
jgi:hypothetical protein